MKIYIIDLLGEKYHANFDLSISKCIKRENKTFIGSKDQLKYFINSGIDSTYIIEPLKKGIFNKKISGFINLININKTRNFFIKYSLLQCFNNIITVELIVLILLKH